jgi:hypothetical protein
LDQLDGFKDQKRAAAYKLLSKYAAHVTPEGFTIISPGNLTQIGPFVEGSLLTAVVQELVKVLPPAVLHVAILLNSEQPEVKRAESEFLETHDRWRAQYQIQQAPHP